MAYRKKPGLTFYFRSHQKGMHVRDEYGGHQVVIFRGGTPSSVRTEGKAGKWYGRINFQNHGRFGRGTRDQSELQTAFEAAPPSQVVHVPPLTQAAAPLPKRDVSGSRSVNQGMKKAMESLVPPPKDASATSYAQALHLDGQFEWCHLLAHSFGGEDGPGNVVAGTAHNNSEQLIIENLLHSYSQESGISVRVSASVENAGYGKYMGNVIRYEILAPCGMELHSIMVFLDCRAQEAPTNVHLCGLMELISRRLNRLLYRDSQPQVTSACLQLVLSKFPDQFSEKGYEDHSARLPKQAPKRAREDDP